MPRERETAAAAHVRVEETFAVGGVDAQAVWTIDISREHGTEVSVQIGPADTVGCGEVDVALDGVPQSVLDAAARALEADAEALRGD